MSPSRGLRIIRHQGTALKLLPRSRARQFATCSSLSSGHNRWSKIKHDKGKKDAAINKQRSIFAQEIATASKLFGPDPNSNGRLADLITKAKREGFAKLSIEAAIARGQGRTSSGASLEGITVEGMLPNNVAVIIDCETDNKLRTLADVRVAIRSHGGTLTPTSYLFNKKGKITFEQKTGVGVDEVLEPALEAGATDVEEDEDGKVVVYTEPGDTRAVGDAISSALGLDVATSRIIWDPNEDTKIGVPNDTVADDIEKFVDELQEKEPSVQALAMNLSQGSLDADVWKELQARISS